MTIGVIVFVCEKYKSYEDIWLLGWSFYFACLSWCMSILLIPFLCICAKDTKIEFKTDEYIKNQPIQSGRYLFLEADIPLVDAMDTVSQVKEESKQRVEDAAFPDHLSVEKGGILAESKTRSSTTKESSVSFEKGSETSNDMKEYSTSEDDSYNSDDPSYSTSRSTTTASTRNNDFV